MARARRCTGLIRREGARHDLHRDEAAGAFVIDLERREDNRGFFARTFCQHEFEEHGLNPVIAQANVAFNKRRGACAGCTSSFRRLPRRSWCACTRGAILDIIVDLRPESPTYLEHVSVELTADNRRALYVPERFAHGYQALADDTETRYQVGEFYTPEAEGGLAFDDPRLGLAVAAGGDGDLGQGSRVGAARRGRGRGEAPHDGRDRGCTMIIVDNALRAREEEGRPIRVGMIGAGFMAQGLANQIMNSVPGMVMAVYNRRPERAVEAYAYAGPDAVVVGDQDGLEDTIRGRPTQRSRRTRSTSAAPSRST